MNAFQKSESSFPGHDELERIVETEEGQRLIDSEFQSALEGAGDGFSRRRWLQLMGASLALGAAGCRYQEEKIAPYAFRPAGRIPGVPVHYSTTMELGGVARPLRATSYDGRPIKLDGNRSHPDSMGSSDSFTQAAILELYDPDRLRGPATVADGQMSDLSRQSAMQLLGEILGGSDLKGVAILAEPTASPTLAGLKKEFESRGGKWVTWTPVNDDNSRAGAKAAFGKAVRPHYHLDKASVIVSLDSDLLGLDPAGLRNSRKFAAGRDADHGKMSRLYVVEPDYSLTGASADHRLAVAPSLIEGFAGALASAIRNCRKGGTVDPALPYREKVLAAMAQDLVDNPGAGVIAVGERQPAAVHALAHKLNADLGNNGSTIEFTELADADRAGCLESAVEFASALESGEITRLVVIGGNPVYDFPANIDVGAAIRGLEQSVHLSLYANETSEACKAVIDVAHPLESWGDGLAYDGSWCLAQPLVSPLFGGMSVIEALATGMNGANGAAVSGLELIRKSAVAAVAELADEMAWARSVESGFVEGSGASPVSLTAGEVAAVASTPWNTAWNGSSVEVVFATSRTLYDGRYANNGWLQELPDFITKICWDNAALMSESTANKLGARQNTLINVEVGGTTLAMPVHITPGVAEGTVSLEIGYGRTAAGRVGGHLKNGVESVGVNVNKSRNVANWHFNTGARVTGNGKTYTLASVQELWTTDSVGRDEIQRRMFIDKSNGQRSGLVREGTYASYSHFMENHSGHGHEHGHDDHSHEEGDGHEHSGDSKAESADSRKHALPVIGAAAMTPVTRVVPLKEDSHGHAAQWPEGFHVHHESVDITPGVRVKSYNPNNDNKWGMSIDLNACTGCSSCVTACQAENNIPIVGKWQVWRGREMHWMRIDRYFGENLYNREAGEAGEMQIVHQPVTCHHCENAPCETVCPVAATVHSDEGLNDMVYNRCIGTRYCGNNCPYKVRRFNYLNYSDAVTLVKYPGADKLSAEDRALQNLMMNPEVTIRSRGVMEKCTYCVQRIQNVKITAKNEFRKIGPNEIQTACQEACPTGAIKFGDLLNKESDVARAHANVRSYVMLEELNNHPRTKYLARVRNPHPSLVSWVSDAGQPGDMTPKTGSVEESHA